MDAFGFAKNLVDIGFAIKDSVDKVAQNSKRARQLTDDIVDTLADLKNLHDNDDRGFAGVVHLREASARLQRNLESVHSHCQNLVPEQKRGKLLVKAKATYVAWKNRDDIEGELLRLKEHAADCLAKFTAFSTARTETAVARAEHALVLHLAETRFQRSRVDVLVGKMLIDSPWGEQALKTIEINISKHRSIERDYLKLQAHILVERMNAFVATWSPLKNEEPNANHRGPVIPVIIKPRPSIAVVHEIWLLRCSIEDADKAPSLQDTAGRLNNLGCSLTSFKLRSEAMAAHQGASKMYQSLSPQHPDFLPRMVNSDLNFVDGCINQASLAIPIITRAMAALDSYVAQTGEEARILRARAICLEGSAFFDGKDFESASQSFSASLNLYEDIIHDIPSIFPNTSPRAVQQLAAIFMNASKACCGYAKCKVETGCAREAVSILMQGLSQYRHLPSWVINDFDAGMFGRGGMSASLKSTIIKQYVEGQLSIAFLHDVVGQLLPLAVLRPRILSIALWDISAIYASLSAAHLTVPYDDVIPAPVSPKFTPRNAYDTLPIRLPAPMAELLSSVDMDILFHNFYNLPWSWDLYCIAPFVGRIITVDYIKKHAEMLAEHDIPRFLQRLSDMLGSHTPEEDRLPISEVANTLFTRILREERHGVAGDWYALILFRLGMYKSALDMIEEYLSTPLIRTMSVRIVSLVKVGRTSDAIPLAQPFILEFWSHNLSKREAVSSWADVCQNTQWEPEPMTGMKMAWMLSAGYCEDVPGVELYETRVCSLKRVVDELHEFAMARGGSRGECTPLIPRELWDMFRSKCSDRDPATLLVGSQTSSKPDPPILPLILDSAQPAHTSNSEADTNGTPSPQPITPTPTSPAPDPGVTDALERKDAPSGSAGANDPSSADPETETCEERTPPPHPTTSTSASPAAHPEITHVTPVGNPPTLREWYRPTLGIRLGLDIAAVVIVGIAFYRVIRRS